MFPACCSTLGCLSMHREQRTAQARQVCEGQIIGAEEHVAGHELQLRVAAVVPQARDHLGNQPVALHRGRARGYARLQGDTVSRAPHAMTDAAVSTLPHARGCIRPRPASRQ